MLGTLVHNIRNMAFKPFQKSVDQDIVLTSVKPASPSAPGPMAPSDRAFSSASISVPVLPDGRRILTEEAAYHVTGFCFSSRKKWLILASVAVVQLSMNFNAAVYGNAGSGVIEAFKVSEMSFKVGQAVFLIAYAFGCELWAPFSEEFGRKWVLQASLALVNLCQVPCALSSNMVMIQAFRFLGGLSSAGGSVTLGMVADMFEPFAQQHPTNFVVLASCSASVIAPIFGCLVEVNLPWTFVFWVQLAFGALAQFLHLWVPETRSTVRLDREAKRLRKSGEDTNIYGPDEVRGTFWKRFSWKHSCTLMLRPYKFLATESIVLWLSLLSGFSDALIFMCLDSFGLVLKQWGFSTVEVGMSFSPLLAGYIVAYVAFTVCYILQGNPEKYAPERRLWLLRWFVILEPIGLFIFGFSALGPPKVHESAPLIASFLIGIANYSIYQATVDYMIATYGPFAASATGGNGFARDLLAGLAALFTKAFYSSIKRGSDWHLVIPSLILAGIGFGLIIPVYLFYQNGEKVRSRSPYASQLEQEREERRPQRKEAIELSARSTPSNSRPNSRPSSRPASRAAAPVRHLDEIQIDCSSMRMEG